MTSHGTHPSPAPDHKTILLADDHPVFLKGLSELLGNEPAIRVTGEANTAAEMLELIAATSPDIAIVDLSMPGDVFEAISIVAGAAAGTRIIVYTAYRSAESAIRALEAGATGFVLKTSPFEELLEAIEEVGAGQVFVAREYAASVMTTLRDHSKSAALFESARLTSREMAIVALLANGYTNRQIAAQLQLSEKTVKYYMTQIMQKLKARNRVEVVISARQHEQSTTGHSVPVGTQDVN